MFVRLERTVFTKAVLCKATDVSVRAVGWNTRMSDELRTRRLRNPDTTYRAVRSDISGLYSTWKRFGYELKVNDKKAKVIRFAYDQYEVSVLSRSTIYIYPTL